MFVQRNTFKKLKKTYGKLNCNRKNKEKSIRKGLGELLVFDLRMSNLTWI